MILGIAVIDTNDAPRSGNIKLHEAVGGWNDIAVGIENLDFHMGYVTCRRYGITVNLQAYRRLRSCCANFLCADNLVGFYSYFSASTRGVRNPMEMS